MSGSDSVHALENLRRVKERHDQLVFSGGDLCVFQSEKGVIVPGLSVPQILLGDRGSGGGDDCGRGSGI